MQRNGVTSSNSGMYVHMYYSTYTHHLHLPGIINTYMLVNMQVRRSVGGVRMLNLSYLHMNLSYCTYGLIPSYVCTHSLKGGMICMAVKCLGACALTGAVHRSTSHGCFQLAIETFNMNTRAAWSILIDVQRTKSANWCWPVRQRMDDLLTVCIIII